MSLAVWGRSAGLCARVWPLVSGEVPPADEPDDTPIPPFGGLGSNQIDHDGASIIGWRRPRSRSTAFAAFRAVKSAISLPSQAV